MTEELKAMSQAITAMAKDELVNDSDGCFLLYVHDADVDGENCVGIIGRGLNVLTGTVMLALKVIGQQPGPHARKAAALAICRSILKHVNDLPEGGTADA